MQTDQYSPDDIIKSALIAATSGLDLDQISTAIKDALEALAKQAKVLKEAQYDPGEWDRVAKTMAYTAKVVDEIARLMAFAKGQPDSRPDLGGQWLTALTDEQVQQVERWVRENQEAENLDAQIPEGAPSD